MSDSSPAFEAPPISELAPFFEGYEFEGLIAVGGMGAVYCAVQKSLDRTVAIKILPREFSKDESFCQGFEAEAKAMARLNHPNLIGVYDFGEADGMLFIIMEYVPGESLYHAAGGRAIDAQEVIRLISAVCEGLAHAHENGILHRDIKPANILLDLNAQPKIGDFGLARPVERKVEEGEEIFGTPHYTAPEVIKPPHKVNQRADIFSVGVMLHELLTGKLPADDRRSASAIIGCDPRFDAIIRKATNPVQEMRYTSASEITQDLKAITSSSGPRIVRTMTPDSAQRSRALSTRKRYVPRPSSSGGSGFVLIILLLIGIGAAALIFKNASGNNEEPAQKPSEPAEIGANQTQPVAPQEPETTTTTQTPLLPEPDNEQPEAVTKLEPQPVPEPSPKEDLKPKFDVADFLENRARKIMRERSATIVATSEAELGKILSTYDRELTVEARKQNSIVLRDGYTTAITAFVKACRENGNKIPARIPDSIKGLSTATAKHKEYLRTQLGIKQQLKRDLSSISETYILGIEKQIERLNATDDPVAIKMLTEEIDKVQNEEDYFPDLMMEK